MKDNETLMISLFFMELNFDVNVATDHLSLNKWLFGGTNSL